jgi:hypothetical protein
MWYWEVENAPAPDSTAPSALPPGVAPEDGRSGGSHAYGYGAPAYSLPASFYDESNKVSCSACDWYLEDPDWCCDVDCNEAAGPHYRMAYVCKDPSDQSGKITSKCDEAVSCLAAEQPTNCSKERLKIRQAEDTRNDAACVKRTRTKTGPK